MIQILRCSISAVVLLFLLLLFRAGLMEISLFSTGGIFPAQLHPYGAHFTIFKSDWPAGRIRARTYSTEFGPRAMLAYMRPPGQDCIGLKGGFMRPAGQKQFLGRIDCCSCSGSCWNLKSSDDGSVISFSACCVRFPIGLNAL